MSDEMKMANVIIDGIEYAPVVRATGTATVAALVPATDPDTEHQRF
jgi:hypothetical protein